MTTLPSQHNPYIHSKYLLFCLQISVVLNLHQENFSLQKVETITENHNQSKCRVVESSLNVYVYTTALTPKVISFRIVDNTFIIRSILSMVPSLIIRTSSAIQIF